MFHSETGESPQARLTLSAGGTERKAESSGSGPVDATFKAIESVAASGSELLLYSVNAITTGTDAQGEVTVRLARTAASSMAGCGYRHRGGVGQGLYQRPEQAA
jgi:2-isopropylmalate synthase